MSFRTTYALFGLLVLLLVAFAVIVLRSGSAATSDRVLANLAKSKTAEKDIDAVEVQRTSETGTRTVYAFVRTGLRNWRMEQPAAGRADGGKVEDIVREVVGLRKDTKEKVSRNPGQYGLERPPVVVTLKKGGQPVGTLSLGNVTLGSEGLVYALSGDRPGEPVAVKRSALDALLKGGEARGTTAGDLLKSVNDFRDPDLIAEGVFNPAEAVQTLRVREGAKEVVLTQTDRVWRFEKPKEYGEADLEGNAHASIPLPGMPPSGVKPLLQGLAGLRVGSPDDFVEDGGDLSKYGLDANDPAVFKIEIVRQPGPADTDASGPITEGLLVGKKADDKGEKVYARREDGTSVVKVSAKAVEPFKLFLDKPQALRDRNLVQLNQSAVDAIDIKLPNEPPIKLRKSGPAGTWRLLDGSAGGPSANATTVNALLATITAGGAVRAFPEPGKTDAELGLSPPSAEVDLWVNGLAPAEGDKPSEGKLKSEQPTVRLRFGKVDKDLLYVQRERGGVKVNLAIQSDARAIVTKDRLQYIDVTLPSFVRESVVKLSIERPGSAAVEVESDGGTSATWKFTKPAEMAGRSADPERVNLILGNLSTLHPASLFAEKANDQELERIGLKPPQIKAAVTLKEGEPKDRVYLFGAETGDKFNRYAKQGERDLVFTVAASLVSALQNPDLQDPTVLRFDVAKVRGLKLTGWKDVVGEPVTRELERKNSTEWGRKGSADGIDAGKAEEFLKGLAGLRAEKFVADKGEVKPEYKLDPKAGALAVEIAVEGEAKPVSLVVGGEDAEKHSYYATSSQVPGALFLVGKEKFEKLRQRPTYFDK